MKKLIFCSVVFLLTGHVLFSQADNWNPIDTNGFGSPQNYDVINFAGFKDTLYLTCGRRGAGIAVMYRSGTGNAGDWQQVIYDSQTTNVKGIASISTSDSGYMWMATGDLTLGTQVYRTENGVNWIPISKKGFGNINGIGTVPTPNMLLYQGSGDTIPYLYAASNTHGGPAESIIFRTPYNNTDSTQWQEIMNFASVGGQPVTQITYFYVWNNVLYFGGNGANKLYKSTDGINFSPAGTSGFSNSDMLIACIIEFNGFLYAGTNNQIEGGQLYRTSDGSSWTNLTPLLTQAGHAGAKDEELHDLDTSGGFLWVTVYTDTALSTGGMPVWRSTDKNVTSFVQSNANGFGNPLIDGENPAIIGFKGFEYFGGPNYSSGGQLWRASIPLAVDESTARPVSAVVFPNPGTSEFVIHSSTGFSNATVGLYNLNGVLVCQNGNLSGNDISLNYVEIPRGMYFLRIFQENKLVEHLKLIID